MHTLLRASLVIAVTSMLFACKPKPAPEQVAEADPADTEVGRGGKLLVRQHDDRGLRAQHVRGRIAGMDYLLECSLQRESQQRALDLWADEDEKALLLKRSVPTPLTIQCSSNESPKISVSMTAPTSREEDVPLVAGQYGIVGKGTAPLPKQFQVGTITAGERRFEAASGTLQLSGFDSVWGARQLPDPGRRGGRRRRSIRSRRLVRHPLPWWPHGRRVRFQQRGFHQLGLGLHQVVSAARRRDA